MADTPVLRRWLAALGTAAVIAVIAGLLYIQNSGPNSTRSGNPLLPGLTAAEGNAARSWSVWGGSVQRNLVNLIEKDIATDWSTKTKKEKNIKWSINLGSKAYGGPTIGGGRIFVGTNNNRPRNPDIRGDKGVVMCFSEATGDFQWQMVHDKLLAGRVNDWPEEGICSAPAIEGNLIYYVSNRCEVICATVEGMTGGKNVGQFKEETYKSKLDGDIVWKLDMIKDLGVFPHNLATCSPIIVGDTLFLITSNGVDEGHINIPSPDAPSFLAVNKKTGKVMWSSKLPGRNIMHGQWSNPVYADIKGAPQVIFPGGDGILYGLNPTNGELIWKFDCNPKGAKYLLGPKGTRNDFVCTPILWENKLYVGVGQDPEHKKGVGHLWCIDITKKPANKEKDLSPYSDPKDPAPQFDPKDPRNKDSGLVWHYGGFDKKEFLGYKFGRTMSTCAVHDGLCYAADFDGRLHCFDASTGKLHWRFEPDIPADTWSSPYWVDGHIYFGNENGEMHIFKHGKKMELVKSIEMKGKIRATPVAVNGVLYVMTENPCRLFAIKK